MILPKIIHSAKVKHTGDFISLFNMNPMLMLPQWGQDSNIGPTQKDLVF